MPVLSVHAPAKLNLHLRIREKRPDGFHNLESIFAALAFGDTLLFEPLEAENSLEITMKNLIPREKTPLEALPPEKNSIFRAVSLFRSRTGFTRGLRVGVEKRIPLGGGLGGGSSDAAAALLTLNVMGSGGKGGLLDPDSLAALAASLGSDVPFFLEPGGLAWVSGRGESIRPLGPPKKLFVVLVNPGFPSETAAAFRLLDRYRKTAAPCGPAFSESDLIGALAGPPRRWPFTNDFLPVFERAGNAGAAYREILARLETLGAEFSGLSGAGSTCFGVFSEAAPAEQAEKILSKQWNFVKVTFLLAWEANPVLQ
jgi:4-diphosphocytidyl-2-C-methyl-D-erythritol kinase